ncbi:MAG: MlaD family protein [Pseudomonadota bacterium]
MERPVFWYKALGAAVLLAVLGLGALALGAWREAPDEGYLAYATFRDSKGLRPGAEVRLSGQQIGHVEDVRLDPGSLRAEMTLRLDPAYGLPDSSLARLDRDGFLDPWHVAVDLGSSPFDLEPGGRLNVAETPDWDALWPRLFSGSGL